MDKNISLLGIINVLIILYGWTHEWSIVNIILVVIVVSVLYYVVIIAAIYYLFTKLFSLQPKPEDEKK
jgi:hypothetical protein